MKIKRILSTGAACFAISVYAMLEILLMLSCTQIAAAFGHGLGWSCLLFTASAAPYILISPFAGKWIALAGRHFSIALALAFASAGAAFLSYADRFWLVFPGLALLGTAALFVLLSATAAIPHLAALSCTDAVSFFTIPAAFGAALGGGAIVALTAFGYGWRALFLAFSALSAAAALLLALIPFPRLDPLRPRRWHSEFLSTLRMRRMLPLLFSAALYAGLEILTTAGISFYMIHALGYTTLISALAVSVIWLFAALGRLACPRLLSLFTPASLSSLLCLILLAALIVCTAIPDGKVFWFAICFAGLGLSGLRPFLFASALDAQDGTAATVSALLLWACAGSCIVLAAAGALCMLFGPRAALLSAIALLLPLIPLLARALPSASHVPARPDWSAPEAMDIPELEFDELEPPLEPMPQSTPPVTGQDAFEAHFSDGFETTAPDEHAAFDNDLARVDALIASLQKETAPFDAPGLFDPPEPFDAAAPFVPPAPFDAPEPYDAADPAEPFSPPPADNSTAPQAALYDIPDEAAIPDDASRVAAAFAEGVPADGLDALLHSLGTAAQPEPSPLTADGLDATAALPFAYDDPPETAEPPTDRSTR